MYSYLVKAVGPLVVNDRVTVLCYTLNNGVKSRSEKKCVRASLLNLAVRGEIRKNAHSFIIAIPMRLAITRFSQAM